MVAVFGVGYRMGGTGMFYAGDALAGRLKLRCGPWARHTKCALIGQLKLNWVQVRLSHGVPRSRRPGWVAGAEAGMDGSVLGCSTQGVSWQAGLKSTWAWAWDSRGAPHRRHLAGWLDRKQTSAKMVWSALHCGCHSKSFTANVLGPGVFWDICTCVTLV